MKFKKFATIADLHIPDEHAGDIRWALGKIRDFAPDVLVVNGDLFEAEAFTRWEKRSECNFYKECIGVNAFLGDARDAVSDACEIVITLGNHDDNAITGGRIQDGLEDMTDWRKRRDLIPNLDGVKWKPYVTDRTRCVYRLGQVGFMHGFDISDSGLQRQMYEYCDPWGCLITGHTHRPTELIQARHCQSRLPFWRISQGCMQDYENPDKVRYMKRKSKANWGRGIVLGEAGITKSPRAKRYWKVWPVIKKIGVNEEQNRWGPAYTSNLEGMQ